MASTALILASASPRRRELLELAGLRFSVRLPEVDEAARRGEAPQALVRRLARMKARAVAADAPGAAVVAADTVVALGTELLEKPGSPTEAKRMLRSLSGRSHQVWTGVAIVRDREEEVFGVRTEVRFRDLDPQEIEGYVQSGEPMDKAGAYGIQGRAAGFVLSIEGSYTNVVGLPLAETLLALRRFSIEAAWPTG